MTDGEGTDPGPQQDPPGITHCSECENLHPGWQTTPTYGWLCMRHKRLRSPQFLHPDLWDRDAPFLRCIDVNAGACPIFEPRRENPAAKPDAARKLRAHVKP